MEATKVLTQNKTKIRDILMRNIHYAIGHVFEEKLLVHFEYTNLKTIPLPFDAATVLVDKMLYRGETTCRTFVRLLQDRKLTDEFPELRTLPWHSPPALPSIDPSTSCVTTQICSPVQVHKIDTTRIGSPFQVHKKGDDKVRHFVDQHRPSLIQRVTMVAPILDLLLDKGVLTGENYSIVRSKHTNTEMMREIYKVLDSSGPKAKEIFYRSLEENERYLLNDLRETTSDVRAKGVNKFSKGTDDAEERTRLQRPRWESNPGSSSFEGTALPTAPPCPIPNISVSPNVLIEDATNGYRLKFTRAGLFQCSQTGMWFKTTGEGEVLYRIHQWDERQLQSTRSTAAGPLYSIECPQETVCQLLLPHCEITPGDLSVAHITDEGLSLLKPQKVTQTHVVVNVTHLSFYGLLKRTENCFSPTCGQVLLFLRPPGRRKQILSVILVPGNLPTKEVKVQREKDEHIETTSDCNNLTPNQVYRLLCTSYHVQPEAVTYRLNYGPNYHPTFQVTFDLDADEFTLQLLGPGKDLVWEQYIDLAAQPQVAAASVPALPQRVAASVPALPQRVAASVPASHFVDQHRCSLIERVTMVDSILDLLLGERAITQYGYDQVRSKATTMARMRELYTFLNCSGSKAKDVFYKGLERNEPMLLEDLRF